MTARLLLPFIVVFCAAVLMSADLAINPNPAPTEQRIFLSGGEVRALSVAYTTFLASKETAGSSVPLVNLRVNIRNLSDGYHIDFECYPNEATSWTYQYVVDPTNFQIRLAGMGTSNFHG
jgi:hypothetical protein